MARGRQRIVRPPGLPYGQGEKLAEAQRQIPVAAAPPVAAPQPTPAAPGPPPVAPGGLYAPTDYPDEPVHTGLGQPGPDVDDRALLEALARRFPVPGMWRMLEEL